MVRYRSLRAAAIALAAYGVLGLGVAAAMIVVGISTFGHISDLQKTLGAERASLVQSIRTVSATLGDTVGATTGFSQSIDSAGAAADQASVLANQSAGTFRDLGNGVATVTILGLQPLAGLAPQFSTSADQLQELAISLGSTRDALAQDKNDVERVGGDLSQLQTQVDAVANSLSQPGVLGLEAQSLVPFQVAFYGMCLLVFLHSAFTIVAGVALFRLQRALGPTESLFPHVRTATTIGEAECDHVRMS
jgi:hypothetical protein